MGKIWIRIRLLHFQQDEWATSAPFRERASDTLRLQDAPNSRGFELDNLETSLEWDDIEVMLENMVKLKVFSPPVFAMSIPRDGAPGDANAGDFTPIP